MGAPQKRKGIIPTTLWPNLPAIIMPVGMPAGLAGGGARNMTRYQPALTHALWVNIRAGWHQYMVSAGGNGVIGSHTAPCSFIILSTTACSDRNARRSTSRNSSAETRSKTA